MELGFELKEGALILKPEDRIDSGNAAEAEAGINELVSSQPHERVTLDAARLRYISSAGLRVVLRLLKKDPTLTIVNASSEVYEILDMTGFTEMLPVSKAYREMSVEGCEVIGRGAKGTVYRYNEDTVIKVYKDPDSLPDIKNERELAKRAFVLGVPTAISYEVVRVGESYGSMFELLNARSYSRAILEEPEERDRYIRQFAEMLKKIHQTSVKAEDMPDIKRTVFQWYELAAPYLSAPAAEKLSRLLHALPDVMTMLHCDYHTNNVMDQDGQAILIDMDTLSHGYPIFDLACVYVSNVVFGEQDPLVVENFLGIPYALACEIWKRFLPFYLETEDPERLSEVEDKIRIVSYLRLMRHHIRRGALKTEQGAETVGLYRSRLEELLERYDTLTF